MGLALSEDMSFVEGRGAKTFFDYLVYLLFKHRRVIKSIPTITITHIMTTCMICKKSSCLSVFSRRTVCVTYRFSISVYTMKSLSSVSSLYVESEDSSVESITSLESILPSALTTYLPGVVSEDSSVESISSLESILLSSSTTLLPGAVSEDSSV